MSMRVFLSSSVVRVVALASLAAALAFSPSDVVAFECSSHAGCLKCEDVPVRDSDETCEILICSVDDIHMECE